MKTQFTVSSPDGISLLTFYPKPPRGSFSHCGRRFRELILLPTVGADFAVRAYRDGVSLPLGARDRQILAAFFFRFRGLPLPQLSFLTEKEVLQLTAASASEEIGFFSRYVNKHLQIHA